MLIYSAYRGQIPSGATGNPYGPGVAHQMPAGPPVSMNQPPVGLKAGPVPPNMPSGPSSLGPPSNTPNGHAPPINAPQAMNGAPPPGSQPINSNQGPPFMTGYPPGQYNSSSVPSVNNSQQINTTQTSQFPPVSSSNGQNPTVAPFTGPTMAGRGGPPIQSMPHSQPPIPSNGPTQPGISSPTRPPPPGALSSPSQFQQAQFSQRPGDVPQLPNRPQMPGMPPMPPTFSGGPTGMTPMPGQMMPPPPMNGPGGIRPPGMGPMPPNSMGGYPSSSTGINTASSVRKYFNINEQDKKRQLYWSLSPSQKPYHFETIYRWLLQACHQALEIEVVGLIQIKCQVPLLSWMKIKKQMEEILIQKKKVLRHL